VSEADLDTHPGLGVLARRIAPRGLCAPASEHVDGIRVALRHDTLDPSERAQLTALRERGATLELLRARSAPNAHDQWVFSAPRSPLTGAAQTAIVRTLLFAHDRAAATPGPARLMGVVNVTPDSFSDGGRFRDPKRAVEHGLALAAAGAEILDIGGESSRPGALPVGLDEELARVIPVVSELARRTRVAVSIDTQKSEVARRAIECGASIVNDVSAGRFDPHMLAIVAEHGAGFVAMHMQGTPRDMQSNPAYVDPVSDVLEFLRERAAACVAAGIPLARLWIDPGVGFGKRLEDNLDLLRRLSELRSLGLPICLGVSRKSFIGRLAGERRAALGLSTDSTRSTPAPDLPVEPTARLAGTAAALTLGILGGAEVLRVHDVAAMHEATSVASALTTWRARVANTR
jgi:dihydropteroate synthase